MLFVACDSALLEAWDSVLATGGCISYVFWLWGTYLHLAQLAKRKRILLIDIVSFWEHQVLCKHTKAQAMGKVLQS